MWRLVVVMRMLSFARPETGAAADRSQMVLTRMLLDGVSACDAGDADP
jgi:hypothetical protein